MRNYKSESVSYGTTRTVGQLSEMRSNTVGNACGTKLDTASQIYPSDSDFSAILISRSVKVVNLPVVLSTYEKSTTFPWVAKCDV